MNEQDTRADDRRAQLAVQVAALAVSRRATFSSEEWRLASRGLPLTQSGYMRAFDRLAPLLQARAFGTPDEEADALADLAFVADLKRRLT